MPQPIVASEIRRFNAVSQAFGFDSAILCGFTLKLPEHRCKLLRFAGVLGLNGMRCGREIRVYFQSTDALFCLVKNTTTVVHFYTYYNIDTAIG